MILDLTSEEVQGILNILGELPTKTNVFPLCVKITEQAQNQKPDSDKE